MKFEDSVPQINADIQLYVLKRKQVACLSNAVMCGRKVVIRDCQSSSRKIGSLLYYRTPNSYAQALNF